MQIQVFIKRYDKLLLTLFYILYLGQFDGMIWLYFDMQESNYNNLSFIEFQTFLSSSLYELW